MTKKQLKNFVEEKRIEALNKSKNERADLLKIAKEKIIKETKLDELCVEISKYGQYLDALLGNWKEENRETLPSDRSYSYSIGNMLNRIGNTSEKLIQYFLDNDTYFDNIPEIREVIKQNNLLILSINKTYDGIIANIVSLKNAKEVGIYLEELGFEVPKDENNVGTSLMTPVDKKYLFLK